MGSLVVITNNIHLFSFLSSSSCLFSLYIYFIVSGRLINKIGTYTINLSDIKIKYVKYKYINVYTSKYQHSVEVQIIPALLIRGFLFHRNAANWITSHKNENVVFLGLP